MKNNPSMQDISPAFAKVVLVLSVITSLQTANEYPTYYVKELNPDFLSELVLIDNSIHAFLFVFVHDFLLLLRDYYPSPVTCGLK